MNMPNHSELIDSLAENTLGSLEVGNYRDFPLAAFTAIELPGGAQQHVYPHGPIAVDDRRSAIVLFGLPDGTLFYQRNPTAERTAIYQDCGCSTHGSYYYYTDVDEEQFFDWYVGALRSLRTRIEKVVEGAVAKTTDSQDEETKDTRDTPPEDVSGMELDESGTTPFPHGEYKTPEADQGMFLGCVTPDGRRFYQRNPTSEQMERYLELGCGLNYRRFYSLRDGDQKDSIAYTEAFRDVAKWLAQA